MDKIKSHLLIIGHRGASKTEPENTLKSFRKAIELQADYIEFDVQESKDGEIIVFHDYEISRITSQKGYIKEMTLRELKQLDVGEGEKIPTLQEVINLTKGKIGLQIEIKVEYIGKKIVRMLKDADLIESTLISSFNYDELLRIKKLGPTVKLAALFSEEVTDFRKLRKKTKKIAKKNLFAIHPHYSGVYKKLIDYAHKRYLKVNVWTVNEREEIERLIMLGIDGLITDDIKLAKELLVS